MSEVYTPVSMLEAEAKARALRAQAFRAAMIAFGRWIAGLFAAKPAGARA